MKPTHTLIIGGTKGLGRLLTKMMSADGGQVSVLGRSEVNDTLQNVAYFQADLLNETGYVAALKKVVESRGKINNLIFLQRFKGEGDRWLGDFEVGLLATRNIIELLKNEFVVTPGHFAAITVVTSVMGKVVNNSQPLSYSLVKAAQNHLVHFYAAELGRHGIRVNAVSPITFVKEESKKYYYEENQRLNELYQRMVPLGRMCTSEDVANVVQFLCSDKAAFVTGQNIAVDGGLSVLAHETFARALTGV